MTQEVDAVVKKRQKLCNRCLLCDRRHWYNACTEGR
ncbi:protein of unknown function [Burkholderia multivorans]